MNRFDSDDERDLIDERTASWIILGFGIAALIGAAVALRTGKIDGSYRKLGMTFIVDVEREFAPIQFMIRVVIQVLAGMGLVFFGVYRLLG